MPGLDRLIALLRAAPLSVPVGTSEAIDAVRLLRHAAANGADASPEALRLMLRPVLCKAALDLEHFDAAFDAWRGEQGVGPAPDTVGVRPATGSTAPAPAAAPKPVPKPPPAARPPFWTRPKAIAFGLATLVIAAAAWRATTPAPQPAPEPALAAQPAPAAPAPASAAVPVIAAAPGDTTLSAPAVQGFIPESRPTATLRWPWWVLLALLPALGLLPLLGAPPPLPDVTRRRGAGSLTLEAWPPHKLRRQLVREIAPTTAAQLQRHVRGAVEAREAYARRPRLDERSTVRATLLRGGILALRYRFARLRPAYLVLVHAAQDDDLGVLWARRLAELDVRAAVFRFWSDDPHTEPLCVEVGGLGRRLPFGALPPPWPEQRLVVVARTGALVDASGAWHPWVQRARLQRWTQRALFNPDEPRDWNRAHVALIEAGTAGVPGMFVLPFEDNALDAWSEFLIRRGLPDIALEAPQLYPRLLRQREAPFVGDTEPAQIDPDPAKAGPIAQQLVTQLQAYLGQNGFYWLCACAVPPVLEPRLALLLGEEYFRRCGASEANVAAYMARNWRLLVRLPWLRTPAEQLPQWLRLTLLARLPTAIQDELREVVRGALGRRSAGSRGADGLSLAFEDPSLPNPPAGSTDERHALLVGFVRDGLNARELMLRLPGAWQQWLPTRAARGTGGGWRAWRTALQHLARIDPLRRAAAWRLTIGGTAAALSAVLVLALAPIDRLPGPLHRALIEDGARAFAVWWQDGALAVSNGGRWLFTTGESSGTIIDPTLTTTHFVEGTSRKTAAAAFSADGAHLAFGRPDGTIGIVDARSGKTEATFPSLEASLAQLAFDADRTRLAAVGTKVRIWDLRSARLMHTLEVEALGAAWVPGSTLFAVWSAPGGRLERALYDASWTLLSRHETSFVVGGARLSFSPDGLHWLARGSDGSLTLHSLRDDTGSAGRTVFDSGVARAMYSADGQHIVVVDPSVSRVLRASPQAVAATAGPDVAPVGVAIDLRPADLPLEPWHASITERGTRFGRGAQAIALAALSAVLLCLALPLVRTRSSGAPR